MMEDLVEDRGTLGMLALGALAVCGAVLFLKPSAAESNSELSEPSPLESDSLPEPVHEREVAPEPKV